MREATVQLVLLEGNTDQILEPEEQKDPLRAKFGKAAAGLNYLEDLSKIIAKQLARSSQKTYCCTSFLMAAATAGLLYLTKQLLLKFWELQDDVRIAQQFIAENCINLRIALEKDPSLLCKWTAWEFKNSDQFNCSPSEVDASQYEKWCSDLSDYSAFFVFSMFGFLLTCTVMAYPLGKVCSNRYTPDRSVNLSAMSVDSLTEEQKMLLLHFGLTSEKTLQGVREQLQENFNSAKKAWEQENKDDPTFSADATAPNVEKVIYGDKGYVRQLTFKPAENKNSGRSGAVLKQNRNITLCAMQ